MKRVICIIALLAYVNLLAGCTKRTTIEREKLVPVYQKIIALELYSGRRIVFDEQGGFFNKKDKAIEGRTTDGEKVMMPLDSLTLVEIEKTFGNSRIQQRYSIAEFRTDYKEVSKPVSFNSIAEAILLNGETVEFYQKAARLSEDFDSILGYDTAGQRISVPVDSVLYVKAIKINTVLTIAAVTTIALLFMLAIVAAESDAAGDYDSISSCPLVYANDGVSYLLDAQPLSGAICPAMERSEISSLEHLQPTDSEYRLLIYNLEEETQYLDHLALFYVDHPEDHGIFSDTSGTLYHLGSTYQPLTATDESGNDISAFVREPDGTSWQSHMPLDTLMQTYPQRHHLTFKFPRPPDAENCVLVINAGATLWASSMVKEFLQMRGSNLPSWLTTLNTDTTALHDLYSLIKREEIYLLQVYAQVPGYHKSLGYIHSGGPLVIEDRAMELDIGDVVGDTLILTFNPPFGFWSIDYIGVSYEKYDAAERQYLEFKNAYDDKNNDILPLVTDRDNNYHVLPEIGDFFTATFNTPVNEAGKGISRSLFLESSGYYTIHLDLTVSPDQEKIALLEKVPGGAVTLSMDKYRDQLVNTYSRLQNR